ncbi:MAG: hypothetical protein ACHQ4H_00205 [Ktedonobacterales bacterium]
MNSSDSRGGVAALVTVLLLVAVIVVALVIHRPAASATNTASSLACRQRLSFVMVDAGASLFAVAAASRQNAWAVGAKGTRASIVHWDGRSWADTLLPAFGATSSTLTAIAAAGPADVWAVGRADLAPLILHWDGTTWTRVAAAPVAANSGLLSALAIAGPEDVWALGSAVRSQNGTPYTIAEHWDGRAWHVAPAPPGRTIIGAANGIGPGSAVIAATASANSQQLARWDGQAWRLLPVPGGVSMQAIAGGAGGSIWAAGSYWPQGANWAAPILERWDGNTWSPADISQPEARGAWLTSLATSADGSVWAAGMLRNPNTRLDNAFVAHVDSHGKAESTGAGLYPASYSDPHNGDAFAVTAVAAMLGADGAWLVGTTGSTPDPSLPPIDSNLPTASGAFVLQEC